MLTDGTAASAQITRTEADELELVPGDIVWLRVAGATALPA
jgi:sulfate transport system ATP-binding protein